MKMDVFMIAVGVDAALAATLCFACGNSFVHGHPRGSQMTTTATTTIGKTTGG
jgi:hypothetical protein